jgi:hypothetical protein
MRDDYDCANAAKPWSANDPTPSPHLSSLSAFTATHGGGLSLQRPATALESLDTMISRVLNALSLEFQLMPNHETVEDTKLDLQRAVVGGLR